MKIQELQPLLEKVKLTGSMPRLRLNLNPLPCIKKARHQSVWAHSHCRLGIRNRGLICFSEKGLDRAPWDVIATLAHEIAHFRYPSANHNNQKFIAATHDYFEVLTSP